MFEIIAILAVVLDSFRRDQTPEFTMLTQGDANGASCLTHGPANLMSKLTRIFVNLDNRIGKAC